MFATPTSYNLTPSRNTPGHFARLPERATSLLRDVRRRSQRLRRTCSFQQKLSTATPGTFVRIGEDEVREKYIDEVHQERARKVRKLNDDTTALVLTPLAWDLNGNRGGEDDNASKAEDGTPLPEPARSTRQTPSSLSRRCSSFFTPNSRPDSWQRRSCRAASHSVRNLGSTFERQGREVQQPENKERLKPLRQGYMYKKSRSSRMYRRKYVTLTSDSAMTYYPNFQAYVDNQGGKRIDLGHVTVKVPGRRPQGSEEEKQQDIEEEGGRKRRRVSDENMNSMLEMSIVSLDPAVPVVQFQLCSARELDAWVSHIHDLIRSFLLQGPTTQFEQRLADVRTSNDTCADCGKPEPDWASLNLGIVVCIECSGIHRKLGSHVTKVRSLSLDTWTEVNVRILELLGNERVNSVLEEDLEYTTTTKPGPTATRREKEKYIEEKYIEKSFMTPVEEDLENAPLLEVLQASVREGDMRGMVRIVALRRQELQLLLRGSDGLVSEVVGEGGEEAVKQLLVWVRGEEAEVQEDVLL